jgi:ABC-type iron transport system FetAB permease component
MAEFVAVFLLYVFKAAWYWWLAFAIMISLEAWAEYRKIMRTIKKQQIVRAAKNPKIWTGEEV